MTPKEESRKLKSGRIGEVKDGCAVVSDWEFGPNTVETHFTYLS